VSQDIDRRIGGKGSTRRNIEAKVRRVGCVGAGDDDRRAEGLTPAEARILAALDGSDGMSAATIAKMTYVGLREAEDALAELCRKGETVGVAEGYALTDGGRQRREAIRQRWLDFQQREAAEVTPREMQVVLSVLGKLTSNANAAP
jgi:DNA-binding MarR family transcriptional regulator